MIPYIMDDTKPLSELVTDTSNGLGRLPECTLGRCREERNGEFVVTMDVPITARHYDKLHRGGILKIKPNQYMDYQLFRIETIERIKADSKATLTCYHITYDMTKMIVLPFTAAGISNALSGLTSHLLFAEAYPFTLDTNIENTTSAFKVSKPVSLRAAIGGIEGSILDTFSGQNNFCELQWDNLTCYLWQHRGTNRGIQIKYGKNLVDAQQEESVSDVYTACLGYAIIDDIVYTGDPYEVVETDNPHVLTVDFSDKYDSDNLPTTDSLTAYAHAYATANQINAPKVRLEISFEVNGNGKEYEQVFSDVRLCDTVSVYYEKLGIDVTAEVYEVEYDFLAEKIVSVKLGDYETTFTARINDLTYDINNLNTIVANVSENAITQVIPRYAISTNGTVPPANDSEAWVEGNFLVDVSSGADDALAELVDIDDEGNVHVKYIWEQNKLVLADGSVKYSAAKVSPLYTLFDISVQNQTSIKQADDQVAILSESRTTLEQYLGVYEEEEDGELVVMPDMENENGLAKRFYDVEQKAQLIVQRSEIDAIVSEEVTALGQTIDGEIAEINSTFQEAQASLRTDGLHVAQSGKATEALIDADGLKVTKTVTQGGQTTTTVLAQFTNDDSYVDYLKVNRFLTFGAHQAEAIDNYDIEISNGAVTEVSRNGTGFFYSGSGA